MFSKVYSAGLSGTDSYLVQVGVDVSSGLPGFSMVGVLASEVREAQDRVQTALRNCEYQLSSRKVTVSLSPADTRKGGTGFNSPIAVGVLAVFGIIEMRGFQGTVLAGEPGLDGSPKPIRGILSIVPTTRDAGLKCCFLSEKNVMEGRTIPGMEIVGMKDIREIVRLLGHPETIRGGGYPPPSPSEEEEESYGTDYVDVSGQLLLCRATEIAASGRYSILHIGPAGTGKTMVAQYIPMIMPALSTGEKLEISKVYSICGMPPQLASLINRGPFRSPHHSISPFASAGGGSNPKPGEIFLASRGVLFLGEFPEFQKRAIEILRQPLEEHMVTMPRVRGSCQFSADLMLAVAMNPCSCGHYLNRNRCHCTDAQTKHYLGKISKPILGRIDTCAEATPLQYEELKAPGRNENSKTIRERVERVRRIQEKRFEQEPIYLNSGMSGADIRKYCRLSSEDELFFKRLYQTMGLSARAYSKILKVARAIADMDGSGGIAHEHLCEAIGYRGLEERYRNTGGSI